MRARYKGPSGTGILEVADDATVQRVFDELKAMTGIGAFTLKYGPPMAMKTLDASQGAEVARSLGLHGETLTIVPDEQRPLSPVDPPSDVPPESIQEPRRGRQPRTQSNENPEDINVPWPEREGTLRELSLMPIYNSLLIANKRQCSASCPATIAVSSQHSAAHCNNKFQLSDYDA